LKYPEYTRLAEKVLEDTRSITAVEGTRATLTFRLNKPVAEARLVPKPSRPGGIITPPLRRMSSRRFPCSLRRSG